MIDLSGKKGLVVGIANDQSIAYGCADAFRKAGADLAVTYFGEKSKKYVAPLAERLEADIFEPMNVSKPEEIDALFEQIQERWGKIDFLCHSIAYCNRDDLQGRVVDVSLPGFLEAMEISCYSFLELSRRCEPLMTDGGTLLTMSFYGSNQVVDNYNIMGPIKASLEALSRYLAAELGEKAIRVHALSPGPLQTRAASGLAAFDELLNLAAEKAPTHQLASIQDVGNYAAFLVSDLATNVTGSVPFIDGGYHIID